MAARRPTTARSRAPPSPRGIRPASARRTAPDREAPPRVDYALTEAGNAILEPMRAMGAWATRYANAVLDAQERFEARETSTRSRSARPRR
ncbi:helix-turn-helix transcriptional regulator [Plantactinospora sp. S1510]|uniref:Helix-turn-helix transcriptional regulator n=1 Tax=Plantactinospora alkalitolerans TaxID=2789879 RepID=A0ABS0GVS2_9ACTN|nr:winged helix-turn-helix transcriptional regulator [Plantactinospora alkalitolerans]MBF9130171.1 helix-turn-helix transcriptional regulator [Plantactinospora alkalitolerans]